MLILLLLSVLTLDYYFFSVCGFHSPSLLCIQCDTDLLDTTENWEKVANDFRRGIAEPSEDIPAILQTDYSILEKPNGLKSRFLIMVLKHLGSGKTAIVYLAEVGELNMAINSRTALDNATYRLTINKIIVWRIFLDFELGLYSSNIIIEKLDGDLLHALLLILQQLFHGRPVNFDTAIFLFQNATIIAEKYEIPDKFPTTSTASGLPLLHKIVHSSILQELQILHNLDPKSTYCKNQVQFFNVSISQ